MVMDCRKIVELIPEYSVDMLDGSMKTEMGIHLASCPACVAEADKLTRVMAMVDDLEQVDPPANLWNGIYARISSRKKKTIWDILRLPVPIKPLRWSMGISVVVLILFGLFSRIQTSDKQPAVNNHTSDEFTQGHLIYTNTDLFADPASINLSAALAYRSNEGVRVQ